VGLFSDILRDQCDKVRYVNQNFERQKAVVCVLTPSKVRSSQSSQVEYRRVIFDVAGTYL
jgi:hypothetical protein